MNREEIAFLALGDSYTIGESISREKCWPAQLVAALRGHGLSVPDPMILAGTGWTTDELAAAIGKEHLTGIFELVSLLIGVNNQYRERNLDEYREDFTSLLGQAIAFAGARPSRVLVVSIPDWGIMPFAEGKDRRKIAREIDAFNAVNWEESVRAGVQYADITPISREAVRFPELIAPDGLHPSGIQYKYWVAIIEPKIMKMLESNTGGKKQ